MLLTATPEYWATFLKKYGPLDGVFAPDKESFLLKKVILGRHSPKTELKGPGAGAGQQEKE